MVTCGFTLAEVLITLAVIGVVAALTMPALIADYKKQETVTRLKKAYSTLNQAYNVSIVENGFPEDWEKEDTKQGTTDFLEKYLFPYLKLVKICKTTFTECVGTDPLKALSGHTYSEFKNDNYWIGAVLADGTTLRLSVMHHDYVITFIDLNGQKGPNILGKDIFRMNMDFGERGRTYQMQGISSIVSSVNDLLDESQTQNCNRNKQGASCGAVIMMDGWEIKDHYPW